MPSNIFFMRKYTIFRLVLITVNSLFSVFFTCSYIYYDSYFCILNLIFIFTGLPYKRSLFKYIYCIDIQSSILLTFLLGRFC